VYNKCMAVEVALPIKKYPGWQVWKKIPWTNRTRLIAAVLALFILVGAGVLTWLIYNPGSTVISLQPVAAPTPTPTPTPMPKDQADPLNGVLYTATDAAAFAQLRPVAVMVENHVLARPQSGLQDAEVLYEAMAEGGITRFMAVYLANQPAKVGPVRSARLHYIDWASEYDAGYAHWGGSAEALSSLSGHSRPRNLDEFLYAAAFWRDTNSGKALEHTGYTAVPKLRQVLTDHGWEQATTFASWKFKDDAATADRPTTQKVQINFFGTAGYAAEFDYQPATNDYTRMTGGLSHVDATSGQQLIAKTIVLMFQPVTNYTDTNGHAAVNVNPIGTGKAVVIEDGASTVGSWSKADINARTMFTDANGAPMALDRGKIWIVSVPNGSVATY
jgi:hypothetical protein